MDKQEKDIENNLPITVEERAKWEAGQNISKFVKFRNIAADTFTPSQIKFLSMDGRKNMGYYGIFAIIFLVIMIGLNLYGLIKSGEDEPLVLINLLLPSFLFFFGLERLIGKILITVFKKFK